MKNSDFLNKLKKEGKLEIVEGSEQMSLSYEKKGAMTMQEGFLRIWRKRILSKPSILITSRLYRMP